jgi:hypothetical protein
MANRKAPPIRPGSGKAEYEYGKVAHSAGDPPGVSMHLGLSLPLFPQESTDTDDSKYDRNFSIGFSFSMLFLDMGFAGPATWSQR